MRKPNTEAEFWFRVDKRGDDECWRWMGPLDRIGYGRFYLNGKTLLSHRASMLFAHGELRSELDVLHSCDNPACVNPKHLRFGTHADNMRDKVDRGRQKRGEHAPQAKLTDAHIKIIKYIGRSLPRKVLAREFGINSQAVSNILCGRKWSHVKVAE